MDDPLDYIDFADIIQQFQRRATTLTEDFLSKRGWKFEVLVPFRFIE